MCRREEPALPADASWGLSSTQDCRHLYKDKFSPQPSSYSAKLDFSPNRFQSCSISPPSTGLQWNHHPAEVWVPALRSHPLRGNEFWGMLPRCQEFLFCVGCEGRQGEPRLTQQRSADGFSRISHTWGSTARAFLLVCEFCHFHSVFSKF